MVPNKLRLFFSVASVLAGVWTPIISVAICGAGHGWCAPFLVSWSYLLIGPVAGLALAFQERRWAVIVGVVCLLSVVVVDVALLVRLWQEGWGELRRALEKWPIDLCAWLVCWLYPQLLLVAFLARSFWRRVY
jgi:hypothetical protein